MRTKGSKTDPERGDRQYYQVEFASPDLLSDADLLFFTSGLALAKYLYNRHQLALRVD